jgi:hypothetical protein
MKVYSNMVAGLNIMQHIVLEDDFSRGHSVKWPLQGLLPYYTIKQHFILCKIITPFA